VWHSGGGAQEREERCDAASAALILPLRSQLKTLFAFAKHSWQLAKKVALGLYKNTS
jgi:hypothetical protein